MENESIVVVRGELLGNAGGEEGLSNVVGPEKLEHFQQDQHEDHEVAGEIDNFPRIRWWVTVAPR